MRSKVFHPHHFPKVPRDSQQTRQCWVLIQPKQSFSAASSQKRSSFRTFRPWVAISQENLLSFHPHQQHLSRRQQCLDRQPDNFLFNNHSAMVHKEWCLHHNLCLDFLHLLFRHLIRRPHTYLNRIQQGTIKALLLWELSNMMILS